MYAAEYAICRADERQRQNKADYSNQYRLANEAFTQKCYWPAYVHLHLAGKFVNESQRSAVVQAQAQIYADHLTDSQKLLACCLHFTDRDEAWKTTIRQQLSVVITQGFDEASLDEQAKVAFRSMNLFGLKKFLLDAVKNCTDPRALWLSVIPGNALFEILAIQNRELETAMSRGSFAKVLSNLSQRYINPPQPLNVDTVQLLKSLDDTRRDTLLAALRVYTPALYDLVKAALPLRVETTPPVGMMDETPAMAKAGYTGRLPIDTWVNDYACVTDPFL